MYPPDEEEAGPSTSGEQEEAIEDEEQAIEDEPEDVKPQFTQPTPPPPPQSGSPQLLQFPQRINLSPEEEAEEEEKQERPEEEEEEPQPEQKPEQPPVKKQQIAVPFIGPDKFLHFDREWTSLRHPQISESSLRIQRQLIGQLESIIRRHPQNGGKDPKPNKEELKKMLMEMTKKLGVLEVATSAAKAVASQQGYKIFSIMGKSRPPEEKPLIPPRRLQFGRKKGIGLDGIGGGTSSVLSPKPEMDKTPKRTPVVPIRKPLNQPPLIQTPIPMYPEAASPPIDQNHDDVSDLQNGNENHDDTPITPPLALNKGKRKAASMGTIPLSAQLNSIGEKPEKRPKRVEGQLKKRTSNRLSKPRVQTKEEDEPTYCFCSRVSFGEMIGCDNDKCEIEWFHFECIGLTTKPKGKWFCPNCRHPDSAKMPKTAPLPKIIKELKREMIVPEM